MQTDRVIERCPKRGDWSQPSQKISLVYLDIRNEKNKPAKRSSGLLPLSLF